MSKKQIIKEKAKQIAKDPKVKQAFLSMKPERSILGILGVIVFFILPELIAYIWGNDITLYAQQSLDFSTSFFETKYYEALIMLFEEGMSWFNLLFGLAMLVWLFF